MTVPDPYRTLGLAQGATLAEIKRAYRRLAKEHHPDAGGSSELPKFLAIQAAYELLTSGPVRGGGPPGPADPARPRTPRDAWRRRSGFRAGADPGAGAAGGEPAGKAPGAGSAGRTPGGSGGAGGSGGSASSGGTAHGPGHGAQSSRGSGHGRNHHRRKATPGSTTYDEALQQPFEPDWAGSAWYGQASGTYWTINPREYADPRKHGPEYQERARRAARGAAEASTATAGVSPASNAAGAEPAGRGAPAPGATGPTTAKTHATHAARPRTASAEFGRRSWTSPASGPANAGDWAPPARHDGGSAPARPPAASPASPASPPDGSTPGASPPDASAPHAAASSKAASSTAPSDPGSAAGDQPSIAANAPHAGRRHRLTGPIRALIRRVR